jgi:hypothetical protein
MKTMVRCALVCLIALCGPPPAWARDANTSATTRAGTTWPRFSQFREILVRPDLTSVHGLVPAITGPWSARLSPDGSKVLYVRQAPLLTIKKTATRPNDTYRLLLKDTVDGGEKRLPIPACTTDDIIPLMMKLAVFDRAGKKIVLGVGEDPNNTRGYSSYGRSDPMQAYVYDIEADRLDPLEIRGLVVVPMFNQPGTGVIAWTWNRVAPNPDIVLSPVDMPRTQKLDIRGVPLGISPTADVIFLNQTTLRGRGLGAFKPSLYDLENKRDLGMLPVQWGDPSSAVFAPQWTSDGRYLLYVDVRRQGVEGSIAFAATTIVYDTKERKQVTAVDGHFPVGPGPTETTMVLFKMGLTPENRWIVLYDLKENKFTRLGERGLRVLDACGKYVLYAKNQSAGQESIFKAEIELTPPPEATP